MSLFRFLLLRRTTIAALSSAASHLPNPTPSHSLTPLRTFAYSSAEEAAAERRRRKRRLRIEPPLHALRRDPSGPRPPPDPNAPRLPDSTSSLVGPRLNLHNRVQSLIRAGDLDSASSLSRQSVFSRTRPTVFTCNAIIAALYRSKRYDDSVALFNFFFNKSNIVPNVVSYNFLIVSHCDSGRVDEALEVYRHILANSPFSPSSVTFRNLTKGLIDADRISEALDLLREMLSKGLGADSLVYNNLIKGFLDLGDLDKANELFDELKERCLVYDGVVNATFMNWFFNQGREKEAMESYKGLLDREFRMTPATCNVLLECLLRHGRDKEAWELFDSMLDNHTPPNFQAVNSDTFNVMVNECFRLGKFDEAVKAFRKVGVKANSKPFSMDVAGYNNIIVRFAENDMTEEAERFFEELRSKSLSPDVTGYRTLIDAYLKEKRFDDAVQMFHLMVDANLRVIPEYANRWFGELVENDKVVESSQLLTKLGEMEPKPDVGTYEIVIKGLCKAGAFDQCKEIVTQLICYGVVVTPTLRQFLVDVFDKEGLKDEIEKLLDTKRQGFGPRGAPRSPQSAVPSGSANQGVQRQAVTQPYGFTGNNGYAGSAYQSATQGGSIGHRGQMENPRYPPTNEHNENTGNQFTYEANQAGSSRQGFDQRWQPNNAPAGAPRFPQSAGSANQFGAHPGSEAFTQSYNEFTGATRFAGNNGYAGSAYQSATQGGSIGPQVQNGNAGWARSDEPVGYGGEMGFRGSTNQFVAHSGHVENARNQFRNEPPRFSTQAGLTRSTDQFVAHSGHVENGRYQGTGFSAESGSTRFSDQFAHQSGQWQDQSGQRLQHQNGQWSQQGCAEDARHLGTRGSAVLGEWR